MSQRRPDARSATVVTTLRPLKSVVRKICQSENKFCLSIVSSYENFTHRALLGTRLYITYIYYVVL